MKNTKYQKVNRNANEAIDNKKCDILDNQQRAFDFNSIYDYKSIYSYNKSDRFFRYNDLKHDHDDLKLNRIQKFVYYAILGIGYLALIFFLPFSLLFCLKKVKQNEQIVVYRLGRLIHPAYQTGYHIVFPYIDTFTRHSMFQKELSIPNLQIVTYETSIIDLSTVIYYRINDVIKMTSSIQETNSILRSVSRGVLMNIASKKNLVQIENDKAYFIKEFKEYLSGIFSKWGLEIIEIKITVNGVFKQENSEGEDPALKKLAMVFKSLLNSSSSSNNESIQGTSDCFSKSPNFMNLIQNMFPSINTEVEEQNISNQKTSNEAIDSFQLNKSILEYKPFKLLKFIEPLITENLVNEIDTVYEFHITKEYNDTKKEKTCEIFCLDIKNNVRNRVSYGPSLFSKVDCLIKLNEESLYDLLNDDLKPFTAYLSGKIEIEGDLQKVLKLKKLIKLIPCSINHSLNYKV